MSRFDIEMKMTISIYPRANSEIASEIEEKAKTAKKQNRKSESRFTEPAVPVRQFAIRQIANQKV